MGLIDDTTGTCDFCGEGIDVMTMDVGEYFDPNSGNLDVSAHKVGHEICGRGAGWELA